ncbi:MAG: ParB N-terminal domain-containing protein [Oligoflexia bacterium]|nr:ParB N-terminal domain-containing protein [Oligoflexia bacterium]
MEILSPEEIKTNNPYLRMGSDVSKLEESIRTVGLISPLIINEENILLAGGRRFQALLNLGQTEIPVIRYTKGELEQELLSIDENLVRKDLNSMEMEAHLRRAKELYEAINPDFPVPNTEELETVKEVTLTESSEEQSEADEVKVDIYPGEKFLQELSERTGMKPKQIVQAIKRDENSGKTLKNLRSNGEFNVSQTNELIKLSEDEQEAIIPLVMDKTVQEIRSVVKEVKKGGLDSGIQKTKELTPMTKEIKQLIGFVKKARTLTERVGLENLELNEKLMTKLENEVHAFTKTLDEVLNLKYTLGSENTESEDVEAYQVNGDSSSESEVSFQ